MAGKSKFQISKSLDERITKLTNSLDETDHEFAQVDQAFILGFNYGNVTNCVGLTTNYQLHHAVFPVVGLAFFKASPTDDEIQANLKSIKDYSSSPNGLGSFKLDKNEHLFLIYNVNQETRQVEKRIFNFTKGRFVRRKHQRLTILNDPYFPRNDYNGGKYDVFNLGDGDSMSSTDDDQIDHLIFFIHGVGGVCDVRFRPCVEVVADFKKMANTLLAQYSNPSSGASTPTPNKHLANSLKKGFFRKQSTESTTSRASDASGSSQEHYRPPRVRKIECLPISWHSMTRKQTGFSEQLSQISLSSVPKLRHFLNKVVLDALLYQSGPVYTQTILDNVGNEINRLYTLFMERHPNFTGSISLAGHSLGSVIVFDLLAHQIPTSSQNSHPATATSHNGGSQSPLDTQSLNSTNLNNNNNNNNNGPYEPSNANTPINNTRQRCMNVSHNHRCVTADDQQRYCSIYKNLEELLKDMDLTQYAELFQKERLDLDSLALLTDLDMKELHLPLGARRKLGTYINFKKASRVIMTQAGEGGATTLPDGASCNPFSNMNTGQCLVQYPQLKFKPRCFFSFGSPTTMFLNVRGIQELSSEYKLPTCDRLLNIFHPYDPLAYRFEPLIDARFKNVEPVLIPHYRGGKRIHVQLREGFARVGHDIKNRWLSSLRNTWSSFARLGTAAPSASNHDSLNPSEAESTSNKLPSHLVNNEMATKRQKLSPRNTTSSERERESFETCASNLSGVLKDQRNPLRRQPELRRSQSEITGGIGGVPSSLSSIIESSINDSIDGDDGDDAVLSRLRKFKLENKASSSATANEQISDQNTTTNSNENYHFASENLAPEFDKQQESTMPPPNAPSDVNMEEFDQTKVGKLNNGRRIDHVLQEKPLELFNEYIFAFQSHASYIVEEDVAKFILKEIYQVDGIEL